MAALQTRRLRHSGGDSSCNHLPDSMARLLVQRRQQLPVWPVGSSGGACYAACCCQVLQL